MHSILRWLFSTNLDWKAVQPSDKYHSQTFLYFANIVLRVYMIFDICADLAHLQKLCTELKLAGHF